MFALAVVAALSTLINVVTIPVDPAQDNIFLRYVSVPRINSKACFSSRIVGPIESINKSSLVVLSLIDVVGAAYKINRDKIISIPGQSFLLIFHVDRQAIQGLERISGEKSLGESVCSCCIIPRGITELLLFFQWIHIRSLQDEFVQIGGGYSRRMTNVCDSSEYSDAAAVLIKYQIGSCARHFFNPRPLLVRHFPQLFFSRIGLPFGISSKIAEVGDSGLEVRRVRGSSIGQVGDNERANRHQEGKPLIDGKPTQQVKGALYAILAIALGAFGVVFCMGAISGNVLGFGRRDQIYFSSYAVVLLSAAFFILTRLAAPLLIAR